MAHADTAHAEAHAHAEPTSFIWKYVFSKDHKVIGVQYYVTAMLMALVAGTLAMLIRLQLAWPEKTWPILTSILPRGFTEGVMNPEFYAMLFTMHGTIMVFFVLSTAPVSGFGNLLIPLQVGARDMAFPFLNGLSYWTSGTFVNTPADGHSIEFCGTGQQHGVGFWEQHPPSPGNADCATPNVTSTWGRIKSLYR